MPEWWEAYDVDLYRRETCWFCDCPLEGVPYFFPYGTFTIRKITKFRALQVCQLCCMHEAAQIEATDEGRKFVGIELRRCVCGRAQLSSLGECVTCHRERRMLDRELADIKLTRRILASLKKEISVGKESHNGSVA